MIQSRHPCTLHEPMFWHVKTERTLVSSLYLVPVVTLDWVPRTDSCLPDSRGRPTGKNSTKEHDYCSTSRFGTCLFTCCQARGPPSVRGGPPSLTHLNLHLPSPVTDSSGPLLTLKVYFPSEPGPQTFGELVDVQTWKRRSVPTLDPFSRSKGSGRTNGHETAFLVRPNPLASLMTRSPRTLSRIQRSLVPSDDGTVQGTGNGQDFSLPILRLS